MFVMASRRQGIYFSSKNLEKIVQTNAFLVPSLPFLCVSMSLYVSLCLSLSSSFCPSFSLCNSLSLCFSAFLCLFLDFLSLSISLFISVYLYLSLSLSLNIFLCVLPSLCSFLVWVFLFVFHSQLSMSNCLSVSHSYRPSVSLHESGSLCQVSLCLWSVSVFLYVPILYPFLSLSCLHVLAIQELSKNSWQAGWLADRQAHKLAGSMPADHLQAWWLAA